MAFSCCCYWQLVRKEKKGSYNGYLECTYFCWEYYWFSPCSHCSTILMGLVLYSILPGALIFLGGLMVFLFLAAYPEDVGFTDFHEKNEYINPRQHPLDEEAQVHKSSSATADASISPQVSCMVRGTAVGLLDACRIPGVIPFAICLFFTKLVAYTFLYWLPFYISQTAIGGEYVSVKSAGNLSTLFDVGGIVGGILAGYISDKLNARAIPATLFTYAAIPSLYLYYYFGSMSKTLNIILMMIAGLFVNGPYALITTAVSADLGTHSSLSGNSRALATVTAIIDGTGSMGAALGPLLTGYISTRGWNAVFVMLCIGCLIAGLLLSSIVLEEYKTLTSRLGHSSNVQIRDRRAGTVVQPLLGDERHSK